MTAATGPLLWGRAAVLSAVALATGAFAHVQADGLLPGAGVLALLVACGTVAVAPFLRSQGSTLRIVSLLVAGQSVVHMALAVTAGHRGDPMSGPTARSVAPVVPATAGTGGRSGSYFDVAYASHTTSHGGGLSVPAPVLHAITDISAHPVMALAHLLAAAVCGWWLACGERALWRLLELTARGLTEVVVPALRRWASAVDAVALAALRVPVPVLAVAVDAPPQLMVIDRSASRRGPPRAA
jgi:hypothetical protein